jgi:hypothetical protein
VDFKIVVSGELFYHEVEKFILRDCIGNSGVKFLVFFKKYFKFHFLKFVK